MIWHNETRKVKELIPWDRNPRTISDEERDRLLESYGEFDQVKPICIGPNNEVYDGHQRLKALLEFKGPEYEVDVRVSSRELTEKERERLVILLHKGAVGQWNWDELNTWDEEMLLDLGFENWELGVDEGEEIDPWDHWDGMPEFQQDEVKDNKINVYFADDEGRRQLSEKIGVPINPETTFIWYPPEAKKQRQNVDELVVVNES